jgi:hypothetical protein
LGNAEKILAWAARRGLTEFTRTQILQLGPHSVRKAQAASAALLMLVEADRLTTTDGRCYRITCALLPREERPRPPQAIR